MNELLQLFHVLIVCPRKILELSLNQRRLIKLLAIIDFEFLGKILYQVFLFVAYSQFFRTMKTTIEDNNSHVKFETPSWNGRYFYNPSSFTTWKDPIEFHPRSLRNFIRWRFLEPNKSRIPDTKVLHLNRISISIFDSKVRCELMRMRIR